MKDPLKKIFSPIFVGFGTFAIMTFIVFPGLISANTALNIISGIIGLFTIAFVYYYINLDLFVKKILHIEPGETELDYINPNELKSKKKKVVKKDNPIVKVQKQK